MNIMSYKVDGVNRLNELFEKLVYLNSKELEYLGINRNGLIMLGKRMVEKGYKELSKKMVVDIMECSICGSSYSEYLRKYNCLCKDWYLMRSRGLSYDIKWCYIGECKEYLKGIEGGMSIKKYISIN
jgi:hypothetical protein